MKISDIYVGGWFQRTMLQLSEIYDFLRNGESRLKLNQRKLTEYRNNLDIDTIIYDVQGEEYIKFNTTKGINVKIFEDGLIVLNTSKVSYETLDKNIKSLTDYYENHLSFAFNYLFSLGAPVPKELANIENIYPYFIVFDNEKDKDIENILNETERQKYFEFKNAKYSVVRGDKYYFINNKKQDKNTIERYIEEQIFIREFKGQLHRYLNIHRIVWEKIDEVKERKNVSGKDIVKFTTKLDGYAKTINLIEGRINQMGTYLPTREKIAKSDPELAEFLSVSGYRYETLKDTLEYIKHLWTMTKNYVVSAQKLFSSIKSDVTSSSVKNLTIVSSMTAGAAVLDLFTKSEPKFTWFGLGYFFILALIGWLATKILSYFSTRRKYEVKDIEYEKNIK